MWCFVKKEEYRVIRKTDNYWLGHPCNGVSVMLTLIWMHKKNQKTQLYPWSMIMYGVLRFCIQGLRYGGTDPWILGLSQGHFWSLVSVLIGTAWLLLSKYRKPATK